MPRATASSGAAILFGVDAVTAQGVILDPARPAFDSLGSAPLTQSSGTDALWVVRRPA